MQNMLDRLGGREWRRWCRDLSKAGEKAVIFASEEVNYRSPGPADEERRLTETGTEITRQWVSLRERLVARQALDFNDRDIGDLLQEATKRRVEAMGAASLVQSKNVGRRFYQPFYDRFQEMVDYQEEIWDALREVGNSRDPSKLEDVVQYLEYCESLGELALRELPGLSQRRREEESKQQRRALLGCLGFIAIVVVSVVVALIIT